MTFHQVNSFIHSLYVLFVLLLLLFFIFILYIFLFVVLCVFLYFAALCVLINGWIMLSLHYTIYSSKIWASHFAYCRENRACRPQHASNYDCLPSGKK